MRTVLPRPLQVLSRGPSGERDRECLSRSPHTVSSESLRIAASVRRRSAYRAVLLKNSLLKEFLRLRCAYVRRIRQQQLAELLAAVGEDGVYTIHSLQL